MSAAEQLRTEADSSESAEATSSQRINWIRQKLAFKVKNAISSKKYNDKDAKEYLGWINSETDLKRLQEADKNFEKTTEFLEGLHKKYESEFMKEAKEEQGISNIRKESWPEYDKWFRGLSDKEKMDYLKNKETDLHDPKRKKLADIMRGKEPIAAGSRVKLPKAIREEYRNKFQDMNLKEREELVNRLIKEHIKYKNAFLELPEEIQKKYAQEFSEMNLKAREKFLVRIQKESGQEVLRQNEKPEKEGDRLNKAYAAKIQGMVDEELLAEGSANAYKVWYEALSLEEKRTMLNHSELDSRRDERVAVRDEFYKLSPELQAEHRDRFFEVDVDRRRQMLNSLQNPEQASEGEAVEYTPDQIAAAIEDAKQDASVQEMLLVTNLIDLKFEQHKRATEKLGMDGSLKSDAVKQKADEKGLKTRNKDEETRKTLAKSDKRVSHTNNMQAFSAVEKMRAERLKLAQDYEEEGRAEEIEESQGEELVEDLRAVGEIDDQKEQAAEAGEFENLHVRTLELRRDARNAVRRDAVEHEETWLNHQTKRADIRFYNREGNKELSRNEFDQQVRQHQHAELRAKLLPIIQRRLPGASSAVLEAALKQEQRLHVDLRKVEA